MAVGETEEERNKASLSLTRRKVVNSFKLQKVLFFHFLTIQQIYYIFEANNGFYRKVIHRAITHLFRRPQTKPRFDVPDAKKQEFHAKDKAIKDDIKV